MPDIKTGTVRNFNSELGYGFIETAEGDMFVHFSVIEMDGFRTLRGGQWVEYIGERTVDGRLRASWCRPIKK